MLSPARTGAAVLTAALLAGLAAGPALADASPAAPPAAVRVVAAQAAGHLPQAFAGTDPVKQRTETALAAQSAPTATAKKKSGGFPTLWLVGVGLVAGIGGGLLLSMNRKR